MNPLFAEVITLAEASHMWGLTRPPIINRIYRGDVIGRKSGGTWLIITRSMISTYGEPVKPMLKESD